MLLPMKKIVLPLFLICLTFQAKTQQKKLNILFIAVDDLKPNIGVYGNTLIKTPNIDRLGKMGVVFKSNYCQQAVCGPTRASLMTGRRPDVTKIWDLRTQMREVTPNILTLPQYLISQGYTTSGIGKIYHPGCVDKKFDEASWSIPFLKVKPSDYPSDLGEPTQKHYQLAETKQYFANQKDNTATGEVKKSKSDEDEEETSTIMGAADISKKGPAVEKLNVPDDAYEDGAIALIAKKQMIALTKAKQPFFLAVGFHKPHLPFVAPKKYWDLYNPADMPIAEFQEHSANGVEVAYHSSNELRNYTDIPANATQGGTTNHISLKKEKQQELIQGYYAAVSYMDAQVGILLNTLDSLHELNNTIIVLWGDHGWHLGDHDLWTKHTNFEQATRAPLIIASPGVQSGETNQLSEHVDIFPTICNLASLSIPEVLDGKSLLPLMKSKENSVKEFVVSQYPRKIKKEDVQKLGLKNGNLMGYAFRNKRYRFILWMNNGFTSKEAFSEDRIYATELYDYQNDPLEKVNIAKDVKSKAIVSALMQQSKTFFSNELSKK